MFRKVVLVSALLASCAGSGQDQQPGSIATNGGPNAGAIAAGGSSSPAGGAGSGATGGSAQGGAAGNTSLGTGGGPAGSGGASGAGGQVSACGMPAHVAWARSFGNQGEETQVVAGPSGDVYVLLYEPHDGVAVFDGCAPIVGGASGKDGLFVAHFSSDGQCLWSRWLGATPGWNPSTGRSLAAIEGGVIARRDDQTLIVFADGSPAGTSPKLEGNYQVASGQHGAVVIGADLAALHIWRVGLTGVAKDLPLPFDVPYDAPAFEEYLAVTERSNGSVVVFGSISHSISALAIPASPDGLSSDVAAEIDADGNLVWSRVLGHTHPAAPKLAPLVPPLETPDGTLWFLRDNNLSPVDGLWPGIGTYVATRSPDGTWSAATYPDLVISDAVPLADSTLALLASGSIDLGAGSLSPPPPDTQMIVQLSACGFLSAFGSETVTARISSLAALPGGLFASGTFGAADGSCASTSLLLGSVSVSTTCRGLFGARLEP